MELIGVVCLIALYKFLDSPTRMEPIVIESYQDVMDTDRY